MDSPTAPPAPAPAPSPPAPPAAAPQPPAPAKRGLWAGRLDAVWEPVRHWLKLDDDTQVGLRVKGGRVRRERHTQMRLLFVDVGNSARSQVAEAHAQLLGFHAESAGTFPSLRLQPEAVHVLREEGLDISAWRPKPLDVSRLHAFDRVIVMSDALPRPWSRGTNIEQWNVIDPQGLGLDAYRVMRKDIERRLKGMARRHGVRPPPPAVAEPETSGVAA
jgi:arsenate reductase